MVYIIPCAGMATRMHPITLDRPKAALPLDERGTTVISRLTDGIRRADPRGEIVVLTGFCAPQVRQALAGRDVTILHNPFYQVTNSLGTIWFAREFFTHGPVALIDGDNVASRELMEEQYCTEPSFPVSLMDKSKKCQADYCVRTDSQGRVMTMCKGMEHPDGEYANVTKLDGDSALRYIRTAAARVDAGGYNDWMETVFVGMAERGELDLMVQDVSSYRWTEVDCPADYEEAKALHQEETRL